MKTLGLTGGFQTGKSTVLGMFAQCGALTISSDRIVHTELRRNKVLKAKIASVFGRDCVDPSGVDRRLLAKRVFSRSEDLAALSRMIHPLVKKSIRAFIAKCRVRNKNKNVLLVAEVPLLFEAGFQKMFDATMVVTARPAVQKKRMLQARVFGDEETSARMRFQWPLDKKIAASDFVIDNNGNKAQTLKQVENFMDSFRKGGKKWKSSK
jgi:dephospho-CoA kinase